MARPKATSKPKAASKPKAGTTSQPKTASKPKAGTTSQPKAASKPKATAPDPLETYRAKRDFSTTPEPSGAFVANEPPPAGGRRFVVQRHRARRLHYDFRLEVGGVLPSWAVPKGPSLDPKARLLAVQTEDHPIEYFDFEGVIPRGEYGGGDVIVWDWGTWAPAKDGDAAEAIAAGELHFDLQGEKLRGRFVLIRRDDRRGGGAAKPAWLMLHKRDEYAEDGWDPEEHPRSVKSGRTNDEVASAPAALWRSDLPAAEASIDLSGGEAEGGAEPTRKPTNKPTKKRRSPAPGKGKGRGAEPARREPPSWDPPTSDELTALDEPGAKCEWAFQGQVLKLTNLDKILFPGRDGDAPLTKRDLIRFFATVADRMLPYLFDRPVNLNRYPNGAERPGFWHKEVPTHAPAWLSRWHNVEADPGDTAWYFVIDTPPALAWMANYGALELHPWTSRVDDVHQPTYAYIDIDPGPRNSFDDVLVLARLYRTALEHLGVTGGPKVTGKRGIQIWVPVADGYSFDQTRAWVEKVSRAVGATVPDLVSWSWHTSDRKGLARLDFTQNAINRTLVAPFSPRPSPGAPVSVPIAWDELDDPDIAPDRWTIRTVLDRLASAGDPLLPLIGRQQELPDL